MEEFNNFERLYDHDNLRSPSEMNLDLDFDKRKRVNNILLKYDQKK